MPEAWRYYKELMSAFWLPEEISLDQDEIDYNTKLTSDEKFYLDNILGFFASADCIVNLNLMSTFSVEITSMECQAFLAAQQAQENVHAEVYSLFIDRLIKDEDRKADLFNALEKLPAISKGQVGFEVVESPNFRSHLASWLGVWSRDFCSPPALPRSLGSKIEVFCQDLELQKRVHQ